MRNVYVYILAILFHQNYIDSAAKDSVIATNNLYLVIIIRNLFKYINKNWF